MLKKTKNVIIISSFLLCFVLIICAVIVGTNENNKVQDGSNKENIGKTGLSILSFTENGEWIDVETSYGKFSYPFAFSDIIKVEALNKGDSAQLKFMAKIEDDYFDIYTIYYNDNQGTPFGTLKVTQEVTVSVEFKNAPGRIPDDWITTFNAAQETFNDVLNSMSEDERFTPVE